MEEQTDPVNRIKLGAKNLTAFFIDHLNVIYAAKSHLVSKLPQIVDEVHYNDLREGILETVNDVLKQMVRVEIVFELLGEKMSTANCSGMIGMVEEAFQAIRRHKGRDHGLRDLSIANYMQQIESVEIASFQILEMAAVKIKDKQIRKLLKENYDEARADRTLMLLIATKYIVAK
jgi:ferritin-like metal-binding protein YciE